MRMGVRLRPGRISVLPRFGWVGRVGFWGVALGGPRAGPGLFGPASSVLSLGSLWIPSAKINYTREAKAMPILLTSRKAEAEALQ